MAVLAVSILSLAGSLPAASPTSSLGTARGTGSIQFSLDAAGNWVPLGGQSLPIMDGVGIRSSTGGAVLDLVDGSRINVLPFTAIQARRAGAATEILLQHGRLTFRLSQGTPVQITTPLARLEALPAEAVVAELFVGADRTMGFRPVAGRVQVHELAGARRSIVTGDQPVFLPARPAVLGPLFTADAAVIPPAGARAVFDSGGESLGYLRADGQLVVQPGYTADLTRPFPPKLVAAANARVPEPDRRDAVIVFDVNATYVGYFAGPVFHAQPPARAGGALPTEAGERTGGRSASAPVMLGAVAGTFIAAAAGGGSAGSSPGTIGGAGGQPGALSGSGTAALSSGAGPTVSSIASSPVVSGGTPSESAVRVTERKVKADKPCPPGHASPKKPKNNPNKKCEGAD